MFPIRIEISGPGQTFDGIVLAITEALAARDIKLTVKNEFPPGCATLAEYDAFIVQRRKEIEDYLAANGNKHVSSNNKQEVIVTVNHRPWGG